MATARQAIMESTFSSCAFAACWLLFFGVTPSWGNECEPLSDEGHKRIITYLQEFLALPDAAETLIDAEELVPGTCYRKLLLRVGPLRRPVTFYLSPDQRFLSGSLLDTTTSPAMAKRKEAEDVNKVLLSDESPSRGPENASVTIVEFADFECPYCKRLNEWLHALPEQTQARVRLIYKHFPLRTHPWARSAASFAVCGSKQSNEAFWQLHDFFFKNQNNLSGSNLEGRVAQYVRGGNGIDANKLFACASSGEAAASIDRDVELAMRFRIHGTPTIFVNGVKGGAPNSSQNLNSLLEKALERQIATNNN